MDAMLRINVLSSVCRGRLLHFQQPRVSLISRLGMYKNGTIKDSRQQSVVIIFSYSKPAHCVQLFKARKGCSFGVRGSGIFNAIEICEKDLLESSRCVASSGGEGRDGRRAVNLLDRSMYAKKTTSGTFRDTIFNAIPSGHSLIRGHGII